MADEGLEQLTQQGRTFRPVLDFELGAKRARCVARIIRQGRVVGTGFLLQGDWLTTNHHVLPNPAAAADVATTAQFNYQLDADGTLLAEPRFQFHFNPAAGFYTSPVDGGDDWTVVKLRPNASGTANAQFEFIELAERTTVKGEPVHIIQHPDGRPKEFSSGKIIEPPDRRVIYDAESLGGSSGSPVFNSRWQVIALHHSEAAARRHPETLQPILCNEGIPVGAIIRGLIAQHAWPLPGAVAVRAEIAEESGPMSPTSRWYVEREVDDEVLQFFRSNEGVSASIQGGTQMGKSSCANRLRAALEMDGWFVVSVDVRTEFTKGQLKSGHSFLHSLAHKIIDQTRSSQRALNAFDADRSGSAIREFADLLQREIQTKPKGRKLLLILDRIDALAGTPANSVAASGLLSLHSRQSERGLDGWFRMLLLHTITLRQPGPQGSIFKVAEQFKMSDFTREEIKQLASLYQCRGVDIEAFHRCLGGHPYLNRRAFNAMTRETLKMSDLINCTNAEKKVFSNHLERIAEGFESVKRSSKIVKSFLGLLDGKPLPSKAVFETLLALGVVSDTPWREATVRCGLYRSRLPDLLP